MHESLEEQVEDIADVADSDSGAMLACFGTPCPPYSTQRPKRFSDGTVKDHPSFNTTFVGAYNFLFKYEPMVAIMEQVEGFDLRLPPELMKPHGTGCGWLGRTWVQSITKTLRV